MLFMYNPDSVLVVPNKWNKMSTKYQHFTHIQSVVASQQLSVERESSGETLLKWFPNDKPKEVSGGQGEDNLK